jgi:hypothetical protein
LALAAKDEDAVVMAVVVGVVVVKVLVFEGEEEVCCRCKKEGAIDPSVCTNDVVSARLRKKLERHFSKCSDLPSCLP